MEGRTPFLLENIQTDTPKTVDVRMVDAREEAHLRRRHRVVLRQEQLELELARRVRALLRSKNHHAEEARVRLRRHRADARHRLVLEPLRLLFAWKVEHTTSQTLATRRVCEGRANAKKGKVRTNLENALGKVRHDAQRKTRAAGRCRHTHRPFGNWQRCEHFDACKMLAAEAG